MIGKVYLIGVGPGDPELITLKGIRSLAQADVIVYDFLINPDFLKISKSEAKLIYVGKKNGTHVMKQENINKLLCTLASQGKIVARLKGGDPYIFGRGSEEARALYAAGHNFEVIPGVSSAIAVPTYAGIPVTSRHLSSEVAFVTGHEDPNKITSTINWKALTGISTIVFLMGVKKLNEICQQLISHGKPPETTAATIRWGTTPKQYTVTGTLATLPILVKEAKIQSPAITVVGPVVKLRKELCWFEQLPLFGKRILITRAREQANKLSQKLKYLGAQVFEIPTITLNPPTNYQPILNAIKKIKKYKWIIFTSVNSVRTFFSTLVICNKDTRVLAKTLIGSIGPSTTNALKYYGIIPDITAQSFLTEGLISSLINKNFKGVNVLLPQSEKARNLLTRTLNKWGAQVDVITTYSIGEPNNIKKKLKTTIDSGINIIIFTASSTVINFINLLESEQYQYIKKLSSSGDINIAVIGPITAKTAKKNYLTVNIQPKNYTIDALVDALIQKFKNN